MVTRAEIPDVAICHLCGNPMKVIDLYESAKSKGFVLPEGSFTIECCGFGLTVEDDDARIALRDLLLEFHRLKE